MEYLTSSEQQTLSILCTHPIRELTGREQLIKAIQSHEISTDAAGHVNSERLIARITREMADTGYLGLAIKAVHLPEAREELLNNYPYVKHYDLITSKKRTGLLGMYADGHGKYAVQHLVDVLQSLAELIVRLPENNDGRFIWTQDAPSFKDLRNVAINHKQPNLFGISLPVELQAEVSRLFYKILTVDIETIIAYKLVGNRLIQKEVFGLTLSKLEQFPHKQILSVVGKGKFFNFFIY